MFSISHRIKALMVAQRFTASDSTKRHPRIIMEVTSGNVLDNVFVSEVFSDRIVDNFQELIEKKEVPIDRALGEYSPSRKEITIYATAIELFAKRFGFEKEQVQLIVRLHEFAHAIFHLGSEFTHPIENVDQFISGRSNIFRNQSEAVHEWIAQQLTHSAFCQERSWEPERTTFMKMMDYQPLIYRVDPTEIESLIHSDENKDRSRIWVPTLAAIRNGSLDPLNPNRV